MPIRPPNLDDRRYADILREAKMLIPQYTPEWTNLSDADPGMTLVQLFAWMTEMIIYRLNQVPDKTYIHFLNFIGEERKPARPSVAPLTLTLRSPDRAGIEVPAFTRCATRQREDSTASDYMTVEGLTLHGSTVQRVMAVRGGKRPAVRELPFSWLRDNPSALLFAGGRGVEFFDLDPIDWGPEAYTPEQYLYVGHEDFQIMDQPDEDRPVGRLRIRRGGSGGSDALSITRLFVWEYPTPEGWVPVPVDEEAQESMGMPELALVTSLPQIATLSGFAVGSPLPFPEPVANPDKPWWIRGRLDYERWIAARMLESSTQTAPVTLHRKCDASNLVNLRRQFQATAATGSTAGTPTYTDLIVKLVSCVLAEFPEVRTQWLPAGPSIPPTLDLAVAVDTPQGLLAPVLKQVDSQTVRQLSANLRSLAERARAGQLGADELSGGCFTITNLGTQGVEYFTPIINLPQAAILGLGRIASEPVVVEGGIQAREQLPLSLTFDHRIIDGGPAARFLAAVAQAIENPGPWLMS